MDATAASEHYGIYLEHFPWCDAITQLSTCRPPGSRSSATASWKSTLKASRVMSDSAWESESGVRCRPADGGYKQSG
jgi:hypothetical protein